MARGINKVILIGNLGQNPEVRYSPSGAAMANVSVATTEGRKDRQTGEWQDHTEWHRVVLLGRLAEVAGEYLKKGSKVYIEGRLQTRKWQDASGQERYTTEILANDLQMLDSRAGGEMPMAERPRPAASSTPGPKPTASEPPGGDVPWDDDVPF